MLQNRNNRPGSEPPGARLRVALTALSMAEYPPWPLAILLTSQEARPVLLLSTIAATRKRECSTLRRRIRSSASRTVRAHRNEGKMPGTSHSAEHQRRRFKVKHHVQARVLRRAATVNVIRSLPAARKVAVADFHQSSNFPSSGRPTAAPVGRHSCQTFRSTDVSR